MAYFVPVLTQESRLSQLPVVEGQLICAYDTGRVFVDYDNLRHLMANNHSGGVGLNRVIISDSASVLAGNWYICTQPVTITLPSSHLQLDLIKISTAVGVDSVSIVPASGLYIQGDRLLLLATDLIGVQLVWDTDSWKIVLLASKKSKDITTNLYGILSSDVTKFLVYATNLIIPAGTVDSDTGLAYAVDVPANMKHSFKLRSDTPQSLQDVLVVWGDGSISNLRSGDFDSLDDSLYALNGELVYAVSHTYTTPGKYIVTILGKGYWGFQTYNSNTSPASASILSRIFAADLPVASCVTNLSSSAQYSPKLQSVLIPTGMDFFTNIHNASGIFQMSKNLLSVTNMATKFQYTRYVQNMFNSCLHMTTCDFRIPSNCLKADGTRSVYKNCAALVADIAKLLPERGFDGTKLNVLLCFRGCVSLTGTVPADILWRDMRIAWSNTANVFTGCSLAIRSQVPVSWGGTNTLIIDPYPITRSLIGPVIASKLDEALADLDILTGGSTGVGNILGGYATKVLAYLETTSNNVTTYTLHLAAQDDSIDWTKFEVGQSVRISVPDAETEKLIFALIATIDSTNNKITLTEALNISSNTQIGMLKRSVSGYTGTATGGLTSYRVTYSGAGTDILLCLGRLVYTRAGTGAFMKNSIQGTLGNYIFLTSAAASGTNALYFPPSNAILSVVFADSDSVCFAAGLYNTVIGLAASALGAFNAISGAGTNVTGMDNTVFGTISTVAGTSNTVSGLSVYVAGISNVVADSLNIVLGDSNKAYRQGARILGDMNTAAAVNTYAIGSNNSLKLNGVMAQGTRNLLSGKYSVALGYNNKVAAKTAYVFGRYANVSNAALNKNAFIFWGGLYQNNAEAFSVRVFRAEQNPLFNSSSLAPGYTGTLANPKDSTGELKYNSVPAYRSKYKGQLKPLTQTVSVSGSMNVLLDPTMYGRVILSGSGTVTLELPDYVLDGDTILLIVNTSSISLVFDASWSGQPDILALSPGMYIIQLFCVQGAICYNIVYPRLTEAGGSGQGLTRVITAQNVIAQTGYWYLCTSSISVTLPAQHALGDIVKVSAVAGTTGVVVSAATGQHILEDTTFVLDIAYGSVSFVWSTDRWLMALLALPQTQNAISLAPNDGYLYARCNGQWVRIQGSVGPQPEDSDSQSGSDVPLESDSLSYSSTESDSQSGSPIVINNIAKYGVINDGQTNSVSQITLSMLASLTSVLVGTLRITATLPITPGSVACVFVPDGYEAYKDNGFGLLVPFELNNGKSGTGMNGSTITLGTKTYKGYGLFNLVTGNMIIYIQQEA